MKLIVGLGNPGKEYQQTRHNVGFLVVDALAQKLGAIFENNKYLLCQVAEHDNLVMAKPQTFMNNSGKAVKLLIEKYQILSDSLFVIHDDLDIPLGQYKIQHAIGPKVHNGVNSIEESIKTNQFTRVRIGVDSRSVENRIPGDAYVLQKFSDVEMENLNSVIQKIMVELINDL